MKNISECLKYIPKLISIALPLILIGFFIWNYLYPTACLENRGVWDYKQMKCREDCVTWNWKYGCVPIPDDDKLEDYLYGYCVGKENELNICKAVRLELERRKLGDEALKQNDEK